MGKTIIEAVMEQRKASRRRTSGSPKLGEPEAIRELARELVRDLPERIAPQLEAEISRHLQEALAEVQETIYQAIVAGGAGIASLGGDAPRPGPAESAPEARAPAAPAACAGTDAGERSPGGAEATSSFDTTEIEMALDAALGDGPPRGDAIEDEEGTSADGEPAEQEDTADLAQALDELREEEEGAATGDAGGAETGGETDVSRIEAVVAEAMAQVGPTPDEAVEPDEETVPDEPMAEDAGDAAEEDRSEVPREEAPAGERASPMEPEAAEVEAPPRDAPPEGPDAQTAEIEPSMPETEAPAAETETTAPEPAAGGPRLDGVREDVASLQETVAGLAREIERIPGVMEEILQRLDPARETLTMVNASIEAVNDAVSRLREEIVERADPDQQGADAIPASACEAVAGAVREAVREAMEAQATSILEELASHGEALKALLERSRPPEPPPRPAEASGEGPSKRAEPIAEEALTELLESSVRKIKEGLRRVQEDLAELKAEEEEEDEAVPS